MMYTAATLPKRRLTFSRFLYTIMVSLLGNIDVVKGQHPSFIQIFYKTDIRVYLLFAGLRVDKRNYMRPSAAYGTRLIYSFKRNLWLATIVQRRYIDKYVE